MQFFLVIYNSTYVYSTQVFLIAYYFILFIFKIISIKLDLLTNNQKFYRKSSFECLSNLFSIFLLKN